MSYIAALLRPIMLVFTVLEAA